MINRAGFRIFDGILITAALAAAVFLGFEVYAATDTEPVLIIESPEGRWMYRMDTAIDVEIPGPLGTTHVHIEDGSASISDSPCPNRTCVAAQPISRPGSWTACLPNRVLIRIDGESPDDMDAVGY